MSSPPKCDICERAFSTKYTLKKHIDTCKTEGREYNFEEGLFKCLEDCKISFKTSKYLRHHLIVDHNFEMNVNHMDFNTFEEFEVWLQNEEKKENVRFSKARGVQRNTDDSIEKNYYYCSRTGRENLIPEDTRKRRRRSQGSCKINSGCTSQIVVTEDKKASGRCSIVYYSTHYGHTGEIQDLNVSKQCLKEASVRLTSGPANRYKRAVRGENGEHSCTVCNENFNAAKELYKHKRMAHAKCAEDKNCNGKREQVSCPQCNQSFTTPSNMLRHQRRKHYVTMKVGEQENIKCGLCNACHPTFLSLDNHLEEEHDVRLKHVSLLFTTMAEFEEFKRELEDTQPAFFCKRSSNESVVYYVCNRSGQSRKDRVHRMKVDTSCPARILLRSDTEGLSADYQSVHVGHKTSSRYLRLTKDERLQLAGMLEQQTFDSVLDGIRTKASTDSESTTEKDSHDIMRELHVIKSRLCQNDFFSVDTWVQTQLALGDSCCVLAYKKRGEVDSSGRLEQGDFLLIIMTKYQRDALMGYSKKKIFIDSTTAFDSHLTTLVIVDDNDTGCPVAFCFSTRVDTHIMKFFFNYVKTNSKLVACNVFVSDVSDVYYNAWISEMSVPKQRLLCSWHVDSDWRDNLKTKVKGEEKMADVYKGCRVVLETSDESEFYDNLENFLEMCEDDPDTEEFCNYFQDTYASRPEIWAYCFKRKTGLNTDMYLESLHQTLGYCYLDGSVNQRLDVCINMLIRISRRMMSNTARKIPSNCITMIANSHKNSETIEPHMIEEIGENTWKVSSRTHERGPYVVHVDKDADCEGCPMTCPVCKICMHQFECDCIDYSIRGNFCKHVHACLRFDQILDEDNSEEIENEIEIINIDTVQINNVDEREKLKCLLDTLYASTANADAKDIAALSASIERLIDKSRSKALSSILT